MAHQSAAALGRAVGGTCGMRHEARRHRYEASRHLASDGQDLPHEGGITKRTISFFPPRVMHAHCGCNDVPNE